MKRILLLSILFAATLNLSSCKLSDLRTAEMKQNMMGTESQQKGMSLLQDAYIAHSAEKWEKFDTYEIDFKEHFFKLKFAAPFPKGKATTKIAYVPDNYDGRLTIMSGKKEGEQWGLSDWASWKKKPGKEMKWKHSKKTKFWLPTYQYFVQFPVKILEANYIRYAGTKSINGKPCEVLFATWNTPEPQKGFDQYLIYIDQESKMITALEYTIRGVGGWLHGACFYEAYMDIEGVKVPTVMKVLGPKIDFENPDLFHQMEVTGMRVNVMPKSELSLEKE